MKLFSFHWNINLLYVVIFWIINIFIRLSIYFQFDQFFLISKKISLNEYIYVIYIAVSNILSGFLIIYVNCVMKKKSEAQNKDKLQLIYKNPLIKKDKFFYLKIILISFLDLLHNSCYVIFFLIVHTKNEADSTKVEKDIKTLLDIIIRYVLSITILETRLFKHHKWSIYAIIIGFLLIVPLDIVKVFIDEDINTRESFIYIAILSLRAFFFPLEHTYIKQFYSAYYILPENLLFLIGIFELLLLIIITPFLYLANIFEGEVAFDSLKIIMSIIYTLVSFIKQYITVKIVYLFSVQSVSFLIISTAVAGSIKDIINFFLEKDKSSIASYNYAGFVLGIIAFFIIIIATLVYDEILIINKWGLNLDVKKEIYERAISDIEITGEDLEEDDKTYRSNDIMDNIDNK